MITFAILSVFFQIIDVVIGKWLPLADSRITGAIDTVFSNVFNSAHTIYYYYLPHEFIETWLPILVGYFTTLLIARAIIWVVKH